MPLNSGTQNDEVFSGSYVSLRMSVGTSAVEAKVGGSALSGRQELWVYNDSNVTAFFGPSGVTATGSTKGMSLLPGQFLVIPAYQTVSVFLIVASGTADIIVQEMA